MRIRRCPLKITHVKASLHRVPVTVPLLKEKIVTSILFTAVETDRGETGYGLTRGTWRFGMREFINRELGPFLASHARQVRPQPAAPQIPVWP